MRNDMRRLTFLAWAVLLAATLLLSGCMSAETASDTTVATSATQTAAAETEAPATEPSPEPVAPPAEKPTEPAGPRLEPATVVRVVDGDTAHLRMSDGRTEKVRFIGVDTPESTTQHEPYGAEAAAYTKRTLTVGRKLFLETDAELRDRYGRLLAYIWLARPTKIEPDGRPTLAEAKSLMFNARLMADGYAQVMTIPPNLMYQDYFLDLQRDARSGDKGLWSLAAGSTSAPAAQPAPSGGGNYIGNRNTMKFHRPNCGSVNQMNPANKVPLSSRAAAIGGGYVPCKNCRP